MDASVVREAAERLRERGEKVATLAVHRLIGTGSFRDIQRILRDQGFLGEDEGDDLGMELLEPAKPRGEIPHARASLQEANTRLEAERSQLGQRRQRLRDLLAQPPAPATRGDDIDSVLEAQDVYVLDVAREERGVRAQERVVAMCEAERDTFHAELARLKNEEKALRDSVLPQAREHLDALQTRLRTLRADLPGVERLTADQERRVAAYERQLQALTGE